MVKFENLPKKLKLFIICDKMVTFYKDVISLWFIGSLLTGGVVFWFFPLLVIPTAIIIIPAIIYAIMYNNCSKEYEELERKDREEFEKRIQKLVLEG